ncbi:hypothetical protein QUR14_004367 [Enterobacter hormaechei]|nr:hypothetical protein [Enterobacter hormaechei]
MKLLIGNILEMTLDLFLIRSMCIFICLFCHAVFASDENKSNDLSVDLNVDALDVCSVSVIKPSNTNFTAQWRFNGSSQEFTNTTADSEPIILKIKTEGDGCFLNGIKILANTEAPQMPAGRASAEWAHIAPFGSAGGAWKFFPGIAKVTAYIDSEFKNRGEHPISILSATGDEVVSSDTVQGTRGKVDQGFYRMTNAYMGAFFHIADIFAHNSNSGATSLFLDGNPELYKSLEIGFSVLVGCDGPVSLITGVEDPTRAGNGDVANMSWVVTVSEA